jgi:hypothetical protein
MARANTIGLELVVTNHAIKRYSERCQDGPGILAEMEQARACSKGMYKKIRKTVPVADRRGRIGRNSPYTHWISPQNTIFVTYPVDRGVANVVTCWKYAPRGESKAIPDHICGLCYHPKQEADCCDRDDCGIRGKTSTTKEKAE